MMHPDLAELLARNTNTMPLFMAPQHAQSLIDQIAAANATATRSPRRIGAYLRSVGQPPEAAGSFDPANHQNEPPKLEAYAPIWMGEVEDDLGLGMSLKDGVATLSVNGAMPARGYWFCGRFYHGYDTINAAIRQCAEDDRVKAIFLVMESPGGVVHDGLNVLTRTIRACEKPIWVHAQMACSASYWIAAQCGRVIAPGFGVLGSIGACLIHAEVSQMLEMQGVTVTAIQFGEFKTDGQAFKALSDAARERLQANVDDAGVQFVAAVTEGRPVLSVDDVLDQGARWYMADHSDPELSGLDLKLCDEILSEEDAFGSLVDLVSGAPGAPGIEG